MVGEIMKKEKVKENVVTIVTSNTLPGLESGNDILNLLLPIVTYRYQPHQDESNDVTIVTTFSQTLLFFGGTAI